MFKKRILALALASGCVACLGSARGYEINEDFTTNPQAGGWTAFGDASLFEWQSAEQNLKVTWDSSRPNSYFCLPLGTVLSRNDDFTLEFNLQLADFRAGVNPQMPNPFQLSFGLLNLAEATHASFVRGSGYESPDLVEFSFFPDPGGTWVWGPSLTGILIDSTGSNWSVDGFAPSGLASNQLYHVRMMFSASAQTLRTTIDWTGGPTIVLSEARPSPAFTDFAVDHVGVCSYSEAGQDPDYSGSILAHGVIDNVRVDIPLRITGGRSNEVWLSSLASRTNWLYHLERTQDLEHWQTLVPPVIGNGARVSLQDTNPPSGNGYYRVRAEQP